VDKIPASELCSTEQGCISTGRQIASSPGRRGE